MAYVYKELFVYDLIITVFFVVRFILMFILKFQFHKLYIQYFGMDYAYDGFISIYSRSISDKPLKDEEWKNFTNYQTDDNKIFEILKKGDPTNEVV